MARSRSISPGTDHDRSEALGGRHRRPGHRDTARGQRCDACGAAIEGAPAGRGLLVFARGDHVLREEPPLCEKCALAIGMTALFRYEAEEDEG